MRSFGGGSEMWRMGIVIWWWIGDAGLWRSLMRSFGGGGWWIGGVWWSELWRMIWKRRPERWDGFCDLEEKTREMGVERESERVKEISKW